MELTRVNIFLEAKNELELVQLQVLNNQVNNTMFTYQTPIWTGKKWVIWFFANIEEWNDPRELEGDALKMAKGEL